MNNKNYITGELTSYLATSPLRKIAQIKDLPFWSFWEDIDSACYWMKQQEFNKQERLLKEYLFNIKDCKSIEDIPTILTNSKVAIFGLKESNILNEVHYLDNWAEFDNKEDAINFIDTLEKSKDIYIFDVKDDLKENELKLYEERLQKEEEYLMRKVRFDGDIIITDPCYLMKPLDESSRPKWEDYMSYKSSYDYPDYDGKESMLFKKEYDYFSKLDDEWRENHKSDSDKYLFDNMNEIGFSDYLYHNTLYGDWSCTTFNSDTKEVLGKFCADSGMVGVFLLDEVLNYNPDFKEELGSIIVTTIKDFHGEVFFEIINEETLIVKGIGNINFETSQTGF